MRVVSAIARGSTIVCTPTGGRFVFQCPFFTRWTRERSKSNKKAQPKSTKEYRIEPDYGSGPGSGLAFTLRSCFVKRGGKSIFSGPFASDNSLGEFRDVMGKREVRNIAFLYGGLYHPERRPPIAREWEPVNVNGNMYEHHYIYYGDVASGHVAEFVNEIKGQMISINPPRAKEVVITTSDRGIRIPAIRRALSVGKDVPSASLNGN